MNKHFCFLLQYEENFVFIYIYNYKKRYFQFRIPIIEFVCSANFGKPAQVEEYFD